MFRHIVTNCFVTAVFVAGVLLPYTAALGGGGSENMLLVVNPNDPASLQVANAYAALRDIPANNILFLAPPPDYHLDGGTISEAEVSSAYLTPIANAISARGLSGQINYIGMLGEAVSYSITPDAGLPATTANSLTYAMSLLTPLTNGSGLTLQNAISHFNTTNANFYYRHYYHRHHNNCNKRNITYTHTHGNDDDNEDEDRW